MKKGAAVKPKKNEASTTNSVRKKSAPPVEVVKVVDEGKRGKEEPSDDAVLDLIDMILDETIKAIPHGRRLGRCIAFAAHGLVSLAYTTLYMGTAIFHEDNPLVDIPDIESKSDPIDRYAVLSLPRKEGSTKHHKFLTTISETSQSADYSQSDKSIMKIGKRRLGHSTGVAKDPVSPQKESPQITRISSPLSVMSDEMSKWRQECMQKITVSAQAKSRWGRVSLIRRVINNMQSDPDDIIEFNAISEAAPNAMTGSSMAATVSECSPPIENTESLLLLPSAGAIKTHSPEEVPRKVEAKTDQRYAKGHSRFHRVAVGEAKKPTKTGSWFYESLSSGNELKSCTSVYEPIMMELQRDKLPQTIELSAGVSMMHGIARYTGPHREDSPMSMSKKDFNKYLQFESLPQSGPNKVKLSALPSPSDSHITTFSSPEILSNTSPTSPTPRRLSFDSNNSTLPINSDSPVKARQAKVLLHQHSPAIRARISPMVADTPNARPLTREQYATHGDSVGVPDIPKKRNGAALGVLLKLSPSLSTPKCKSKFKYIREFPKPKPEVVTVTSDGQQKMAWLG
ncbi:hypothetical protein THRCLA_04472 [Thraustotheca clavata]|uniref:Uncharacterized protein n=1 Tax=Thraustotheca clavata TaxID=74557 RepID=A0A1V9ZZN5_9STRA|nr:hypothetical protein THRCLA_04472 [Thraustotheca clavata]